MPDLKTMLLVAVMFLFSFGVLIAVVVHENAANIDEWWRSLEFKLRKRQKVKGNRES